MRIYLFEPIIKIQKALLIEQIKNQDDSIRSLVVSIGDSFVAFLACCVPDLELYLAAVVTQWPESKVDTYRRNIVLVELVVCKSYK